MAQKCGMRKKGQVVKMHTPNVCKFICSLSCIADILSLINAPFVHSDKLLDSAYSMIYEISKHLAYSMHLGYMITCYPWPTILFSLWTVTSHRVLFICRSQRVNYQPSLWNAMNLLLTISQLPGTLLMWPNYWVQILSQLFLTQELLYFLFWASIETVKFMIAKEPINIKFFTVNGTRSAIRIHWCSLPPIKTYRHFSSVKSPRKCLVYSTFPCVNLLY